MTIAYYIICFLLSFLMFSVLWRMGRNQDIPSVLMMFSCIIVYNGGVLALSVSERTQEALLAQKMIYLASLFLPLFMLMSVFDILRIKITSKMLIFLFSINLCVMICAFTIGHSDLYYVSAELVHDENGVSYLEKEYGVFHNLYLAVVAGYTLGMTAVVMVSFFRQKRCSYKYAAVLLAEVLTTFCTYALQKMAGIRTDLLTAVYIVEEIGILLILRGMTMYDVRRVVSDNLERSGTGGYIIFNKKKQFIGCNDVAKRIFPELKSLRIDHRIPREITYLYENIHNNLKGESRYSFYLKIEDREYKMTVNPIYRGSRNIWTGYMLEIIDDTSQRDYIHLMANYNNDLSRSVKEKTARIEKMQDKLILGMADMVEGRDSSTGGHIKRTSDVIRIFTEKLRLCTDKFGIDEEFLDIVIKAAPMHDLGKIAIDDVILRKPARFTDDEFEIMKSHAAKGAEIIKKILDGAESEEFSRIAVNIAHYHHEKWDGTGYPDRVSGTDIPIEARIMALADVFDALVSRRCYKPAMPYEKAFSIIEESLGQHFDPDLGRVFLQCSERLKQYYDEFGDTYVSIVVRYEE